MTNMLAIFGLGTPEIILIVVLILVLFGAKKLPELARGLGKSLGEFKKAKKELEDELMTVEKEIEETAREEKPVKKTNDLDDKYAAPPLPTYTDKGVEGEPKKDESVNS